MKEMELPDTLAEYSADGKAKLPDETLTEEPYICKEGESTYPELKTKEHREALTSDITLTCDISARNSACPDDKECYMDNASVSILKNTKGERYSVSSDDKRVPACFLNTAQPTQPSPTGKDNEHTFEVSSVGDCLHGSEESLITHDSLKPEALHESLLPDTGCLMPASVKPDIGSSEEIQGASANFSEGSHTCLTSCSKGNSSFLEEGCLYSSCETGGTGLWYSEIKSVSGTEHVTVPQVYEALAFIQSSVESETKDTVQEQNKGCCRDKSLDSTIGEAHYKEDTNEEDNSQCYNYLPAAARQMSVGITETLKPVMSVNGTNLTEQTNISTAAVNKQQKCPITVIAEEQQSTRAVTSEEHKNTCTVTSTEQESTSTAGLTNSQIRNEAAVQEICLPANIITLSTKTQNNESDQQREKKSITATQLDDSVPGPANQRSVLVPRQEQGVGTAGQEKEGLPITLTSEVKKKSLPVGEAEQDVTQKPGSAERQAQVKIGDHGTLNKASASPGQITTACFRQQGCAVKQRHPDSWTQSQNRRAMELSSSYSAYDNLSDSGVSDDSSQSSTLDGPVELHRNETPIEREIRLAVEREEKLRQSRGIVNSKPHEEYVEIQVRPVLQPSSPKLSPVPKHKDRIIAGMQMMKEIELETKREEDLVQLGKVKRMYDKGNPQELQEIKMIFEQVPEQQTDPFISKNSNNMSGSETDHAAKASVPFTKTAFPDQPMRDASSDKPEAKKGPSFVEFRDNNVIIIEHGVLLHPIVTVPASPPLSTPSARGNPWPLDEQKVTVLESSSVFSTASQRASQPSDMNDSTSESTQDTLCSIQDNPFFKLRSKDSQSILEQEIRAVQEREQALQKQRCSLYGVTASPRTTSPTNSVNSVQCTAPVEDRPLGKLDIAWPPHPSSVHLLSSDDTNQPQQDRSPQNPRKKCALLQQWEAGIFISHQEDE